MTQAREFRIPGKLMLAGEWAILELGVPCIVMTIDKHVTIHLEPAGTISLFAPDLKLEKKEGQFDGNKFSWSSIVSDAEKEKLVISQHAIETTLKYLKATGKKIQNFGIRTSSEDCVVNLADGSQAKIGFGSSAAACVGIVKSILDFHGVNVDSHAGLETVFKLACLAHFEAQGKVGSSFDVAASTFGGLMVYKRFDPNWVSEQTKAKKTTAEIVNAPWPSLQLKPLSVPMDFRLLLGYTGPDTSTKEMIKKMDQTKTDQKEKYWEIVHQIKAIVTELVLAMEKSDSEKIIELIRQNRIELKKLSDLSGLGLETSQLAKLADIAEHNGGAGKLSGSGGGGVGIGVCFDEKTGQKIKAEWKKAGIEIVDASIAKPVGIDLVPDKN